MTTTDKISYGTPTAITCTLASLASSTTAGRGAAAVDNSTNLFDDAMLLIAVKTSSSTIGSDKACYVYLYGSADGTIYNGSSAEAQGTNAAMTFDVPTNMRGPYVISCPASSQTYRLVIGSVAAAFGGVMPISWGFALQNLTNQALDSTEGNHTKSYTGIYYTNA